MFPTKQRGQGTRVRPYLPPLHFPRNQCLTDFPQLRCPLGRCRLGRNQFLGLAKKGIELGCRNSQRLGQSLLLVPEVSRLRSVLGLANGRCAGTPTFRELQCWWPRLGGDGNIRSIGSSRLLKWAGLIDSRGFSALGGKQQAEVVHHLMKLIKEL